MTAPADRDLATGLIHHAYRPPAGFEAATVPVHRASTIFFADTAALRARQWKDKTGYTYGLHGTPTTFTLEERLATLEGGLQTLLVPSGLAAIALVDLALLRVGDEVLIPDNAYGPCKELAAHELAHWGITHRVYDPMDPAAFAAMIGPATKLVWLEAAGSVTLEFPDLVALVRASRARGVATVLDNTWGAGVAFDAFDLQPAAAERLAVDITIHALTKYPSGGADVLMGSVTTRDPTLHQRLKMTHMRLGLGVGATDVELVLRSLPTVALRYAAQDQVTRALATWWQGRAEVVQVLHPALPESPGHAHWQAVCDSTRGGDIGAGAGAGGGASAGAARGSVRRAGGAAALVSVVFDPRYGVADVDRFVDALRRFRLGFSWAGPVSLVVPYELDAMRQSRGAIAPGTLVRFAVGMEPAEALIADLTQALAVLGESSS